MTNPSKRYPWAVEIKKATDFDFENVAIVYTWIPLEAFGSEEDADFYADGIKKRTTLPVRVRDIRDTSNGED